MCREVLFPADRAQLGHHRRVEQSGVPGPDREVVEVVVAPCAVVVVVREVVVVVAPCPAVVVVAP